RSGYTNRRTLAVRIETQNRNHPQYRMSGAGFPGTVSLGHRAAHAAASSATSHLLQSWSSFRASIFGSVIGDLKKPLHASNEKEISHSRVSWQTRSTYFVMGPLASSHDIDHCDRECRASTAVDQDSDSVSARL